MKVADLISAGLEQAANAIERYSQRVEKAERRYAQQLEKYFKRFQRDLMRIDRRAATARDRAIRNYNKKREQQQQQAYDRTAEMTERFHQQQRHRAERFAISQLQNERIYGYERQLLVAKGDVLAIEDLDARYALERQAQQENFALQQRQAEEIFKLQLKYARQAWQEQAQVLAEALAEQLAEIEARRREERQERGERYKETLTDAERSHEDQLAELKESLDDQLEMIGRNIQKQIKDFREGYQLVIDLIQQMFGPGGHADTIMQGYYARWQNFAQQMQQWIATGTLGASRRRPSVRPGADPRGRFGGGMQYGGEGVVSEPTTFIAGEAGPEHYSFQPMSTIGGQMTLRWGGAPISVHGTGELSGVDFEDFGQQLVQGLLFEMSSQLLNIRGQRGY